MPDFGFRVELPRPAREITALLLDPHRRPEWQSSLRRVELLDPGPPRVGTRWYDVTALGVRPLMETTAWQAGRRWAEHGRWRGIEVDLVVDLEPIRAGAATLVRGSGTVSAAGRWWPVGRVLRLLAPYAARADLRRLGRLG